MPQEIKGLRDELSTRLHSSDTLEIIREKEEQIRGLLEEGHFLYLKAIIVLLHKPTQLNLYSRGPFNL